MPMNDSSAAEQTEPRSVRIRDIFLTFLLVGATSFGGGVVAYLHSALVKHRGWLNNEEFTELLAISQTLPGLNATNMAVLVGDRLGGVPGALAGLVGMCLPGGILMSIAGAVYLMQGEQPMVLSMLRGVAAAATGLILATTVQLGRKSFVKFVDLLLIAVSAAAVTVFHLPVPIVVLTVGPLAIFLYRPRRKEASTNANE
jgi:chromate transporter